jgi:alpha-L-arabinofuranosidase
MKKTLYLISCTIFYLLSVSLSAQQATIKIDILRQIGEIDRNIYGVFMEPIRNSMDGILYDPGHPLANDDGFRTDYIEAARELQLTNMRWPGGNYTASYNWQDGIGPKEERPVRRELAWGVNERNHVGTDEWLKLADEMGVENSICINGGTGTLDDARYWIEYVNSPIGTYWADKRAENGHPEPYNVKYWHLGNEVDGEPWQVAAKTAEEYVNFADEAAKIMYYVNRRCESCQQPTFLAMGSSWIVHNGEPAEWEEWNWTVLDEMVDEQNVEYIAIHRYWGGFDEGVNVFLGDWAEHFNDYITTTKNQIQIAKIKNDVRDKPFYIGFTEWAPRGRGTHLSTMASAIHFNLFIRHAEAVKRANYTMFTRLLSLNQEGVSYKTPLFYMFKLFSNNCHGKSLDAYVDCETFDGEQYKNIPYLDVSTAYNTVEKSIIINVVNRNMEETITTQIISDTGGFTGEAKISEINANDVRANYTYANTDKYSPVNSSMRVKGNIFNYKFAPHSITQIIVGVE